MAKAKKSEYQNEMEMLRHALKTRWSDKDISSILSRVVEINMNGEGEGAVVDTKDVMATYATGWYWAQVNLTYQPYYTLGNGHYDFDAINIHIYFPFRKQPSGAGAAEGLNEYDINPDAVYARVDTRINGSAVKRLVLLTTNANESKNVIKHYSELMSEELINASDSFIKHNDYTRDGDPETGEWFFTAETPISYVPMTIKRALASGAPKRIAAVYDKWWRGGRKTDVDYQNALSIY